MIQLRFYLCFLFFYVSFDDCYLCVNLFVEHPVFIPRSSYLVLVSLIASAQTSRRRYSLHIH